MIFVECHNDRQLVYRMGFTPDQVEHEFGRSRVLTRMIDAQKAVGVIDEDPKACISEYVRDEYAERDVVGKIRLLVEKRNDRKGIIEISPYLEDWLYSIAGRKKILPESFDLPIDPEKMHSMSLRLRKNMQNFQRFLVALRRAKDDEFSALERWIKEAIE